MDDRDAKRIDSLYRNMKSFPALTIVSLIVPIFLLFLPLLSLVYLYLRVRLLREIDLGVVAIDQAAEVPQNSSADLTLVQKVAFIRQHDTRLWTPLIILISVVVLVILIVVAIEI